ncbi:MAG: hypothetical protein ABII74_05040 [Elusimicrobiota bacterium]
MKLRDFLIAILGAMGGQIQSKTKIQKLCYFLSIVLNKDFGFQAHYYGPYSQQVEEALGDLLGMGFVTKTTNNFGAISAGFEVVRYDYSLTKEGKAIYEDIQSTPESNEVINKLKIIGDIDYLKLSIAAKAHYILSKGSQALDVSKIKDKAKSFKWNITEEDIDTAINFLEKMNLVLVAK